MSEKSERRFPIQHGGIRSIPWTMIASQEAQARSNHSQTLERLAERGGLSACEAIAVLDGRSWREMEHADVELRARVDTYERSMKIIELAAERKLLDDLVASLPKCDECPAPATKAFHRGAGRWCDVHGAEGRGKRLASGDVIEAEAPDYPRAPPLRAIAEARKT